MLRLFLFYLVAVVVHGTADVMETHGLKMLNGSYVLNKENFDHVIKNDATFIVLAYADWCGHCEAFKPTWQQIAEQVNNDANSETKVFLALIDENPTIHNDWDTTSFPTIFYVRNGEHKRFSGERKVERILEFITTNEENPVIEIEQEDLDDVLQTSEVAVVGRFESEEKAAMFEKIAWDMEVSDFYRIVSDTDVDNSIVVYSQHEGKPKKKQIKSLDDIETIKLNIAKARRPFVIHYSRTNHRLIHEVTNRTISVLLFHDQDGGYSERMRQFGLAARTYSERTNFVEMKMSNEDATKYSGFFKIKDADLPVVCVIDVAIQPPAIAKTQDVTESGIAQLIEDNLAGEAKTVKANTRPDEEEDELPEDWESRPVKYLIGENYMDYVLYPLHDVIVMWYRPSCPHCEKMEPIWTELAEKYKDHPTLKVAHIKSSNFESVPGSKNLKLEKVPTILFYKRGASELTEAVEWEGKDRTLKGLDEFLFEQLNKSEENKKEDEQKDEL